MDCWVVVVDDEVLSLTGVKNLLHQENMHISCLRSGAELLRFMEKNTPDLILLDVLMPEMDGFETYQKLRELEKKREIPETAVIFLTGESDEMTEQKGLVLGAVDFIRKPFNKDIMVQRVKKAIENRRKIESLTEDATIDKLTGFFNKNSGLEKIKEVVKNKVGALAVLDLDSFKLVNDLFGHETGDRVLAAFAEVLGRNIRGADIVSRIGGDEFLAFFGGISEDSDMAALTKRLNDQLMAEAAALLGADHGIPLGISIGAVMVPDNGRDYDKLFAMADEAMYYCKQHGKHGYYVYMPEDNSASNATDPNEALKRINQILDDRGDNRDAMLLGTESFAAVYHYILRFNQRYNGRLLKLLFVITTKKEGEEELLKDAVNRFGNTLKEIIRRSDVVLHNRSNQFLLMFPVMGEPDTQRIIDRIMTGWKEEEGMEGIEITYAFEVC